METSQLSNYEESKRDGTISHTRNDLLIDTLRLWTDHFQFDAVWASGANSNWDEVSFIRAIKGNRHSGNGTSLHCRYHDPRTGWYVEIGKRLYQLWMGNTLPRLVSGNNHQYITVEDTDILRSYLKHLQAYLRLFFNIEDLRIGRVDLSRDMTFSYPVSFLIEEAKKVHSFDRLKRANETYTIELS